MTKLFAMYSPSSVVLGQLINVPSKRSEDQARRKELRLTDKHSPEINEYKQGHIGKLLQRKQEWIQMIRHALRETIHWMEGMTREWRWHNPLMVRLMQCLVNQRMVQSTMDPINTQIRENNEQRKLQDVIESEWSV